MRRDLQVLGGGDLGQLDEILAPDFADRTPGAPASPRGPAAIRDTQLRARELFQDVQYTLEDLISEGDRVAARYTVNARHRGSSRPIEVSGVTFFRVAGGKIQEAWIVNDQIELFRQLGYTITPPKPATPPAEPAPPHPPAP